MGIKYSNRLLRQDVCQENFPKAVDRNIELSGTLKENNKDDSDEWIHAIHTEKSYTEVQEIILSRYNKIFGWSLKAKIMGKKALEAALIFVEETGIRLALN
ncbi:glycerol-3-phosphatase 2 [Striga asiatica]|uniref:Glycerol-3-phosphatase 2 n=1 Tax=Striga asiatica TaxID=4170 RepID=A0A5A7QP89_STRAF|nr:glycerol-3-phosphatase 2 [Striga asiatica]